MPGDQPPHLSRGSANPASKNKNNVATGIAPDVDRSELASPELKISFIIPLVGFILLFGVIAAAGFLALREAREQVAVTHSLDVQIAFHVF